MKEIIKLTMDLKARHPAIYSHLDETPVLASADPSNPLKEMEDYRNTLSLQLKEADAQKQKQNA